MSHPDLLYAFRRNLVVAASAGTGKTHGLVGVLVHLLLGESELAAGGGAERGEAVSPARVVATTFSRKAAAEILARLASALGRLAAGDPRAPYLADLLRARERRGRPPPREGELAARARRAKARLSLAQIGTLHGFAVRLVQRHALDIGLSPSLTIEDEEETRARVFSSIERVLAEHRDVAATLARDATGPEALVTQIAAALARLDEDGRGASALEACDDVALLDARMAEAVAMARALTGDERLGALAACFLGAWERGDGEGIRETLGALCDVSRPKKAEGDVARFFELRDTFPAGSSNAERGRKLARAWELRALFGARARAGKALLCACEAEVQRAGRDASTLGFGEVLRAARDVLRARPDVAAEIGAGLDVLMVDEFQDTSRLQRDLVLHLWERDPQRRAPGAPAGTRGLRGEGLFVVGDRKQSIYGFRGADVSVFAELCVGLAGAPAREALGIPKGACDEPDEPTADFVPLRHNRRSAPEILTFANAYSARRLRPAEGPPALYEIDYAREIEDLLVPPEHAIPASSGEPRTTWLRVPVEGRRHTSTRIDEAFAIAHEIAELLRRGEPRLKNGAAPRPRDIAVLAHTNAMLDAAAFALGRAGIPYVVAGTGFYGAREVRDLVAMLAVIVEPRDSLALLEVLRGPWAGVRDETLLGLTDAGAGLAPLGPAWDDGSARRSLIHADDREALARLRAVVAPLRGACEALGPAGVLREAVDALSLEEVLIQLPRGAQRVANVRKVIALAERAERGAQAKGGGVIPSARAFVERMRASADREEAEAEAATFSDEDDAVRLLTVHASKGLDFPVVFVPQAGYAGAPPDRPALGLSIGVGAAPSRLAARIYDERVGWLESPSYASATSDQARRDRAERARLAYVAATRAASALVLVGDRRNAAQLGGTAAAALTLLAEDPAAAALVVRTPPPSGAAALAGSFEPSPLEADDAPPPSGPPSWRVLPIAATALQDFAACPRRFQLAHVLGVPAPRGEESAPPPDEPEDEGVLVPRLLPRAEGSLVHQLLERVDLAHLGRRSAVEALSRALEREGISRAHRRHASIVARAARFLHGDYAARVAQRGARVERETPFALEVPAGDRAVVVRGVIDLLVTWPDGALDVIDYKRGRGPSLEPHAFQLDVYSAFAAARVPEGQAVTVRAGVVFLGGDDAEPRFTARPVERGELFGRVSELARALVSARWTGAYARVPSARCEELRCGFVKLCRFSEG